MNRQQASRIWTTLRAEALQRSTDEPVLASLYHGSVLRHGSLESALVAVLAVRLSTDMLTPMLLGEMLGEALALDAAIGLAACSDLLAHRKRDPACDALVLPFLGFKGFHALQTYRFAHAFWMSGRFWLASLLQSRASVCFGVDIHPAAIIGRGIMIDHGTGIVIGETARVGDDVSMLHGVTLGGSGLTSGQRHPIVGNGVLFGAGAKALGPVNIGEGARIGAGSVVLDDVPPHVTAAGVPARVVGKAGARSPALEMDQRFGNAPP